MFIIEALRGLSSAYDNKKVEETLKKIIYESKLDKQKESKIRLDFSTAREGSNIAKNLKDIEKAINKENIIEFNYTNSYGNKTYRLAELVGLTYKWYAWYMLAYCRESREPSLLF